MCVCVCVGVYVCGRGRCVVIYQQRRLHMTAKAAPPNIHTFVLNLIKSVQFKVHSLHQFVPNCTCSCSQRGFSVWRLVYTICCIYISSLNSSTDTSAAISLNFLLIVLCVPPLVGRMWEEYSSVFLVPVVNIERCRFSNANQLPTRLHDISICNPNSCQQPSLCRRSYAQWSDDDDISQGHKQL